MKIEMVLATGIVALGLMTADAAAEIRHWVVPAMSEEQRLPDTIPTDGVAGGEVRILAAKGEYEPASFVIRSDVDLGKVQLELGELKKVEVEGEVKKKGREVVFPKGNLDLKVVKVWYQNRNGWFSYFADDGLKLCPELLVNDENIIRVDEKKVSNYARLVEKDGRTHEWWLNPPRMMDRRYFDYAETPSFECMRENFRDAKTLQPVALPKNVSKQFFLTAHVTKGIPAGVYVGEVKVVRHEAGDGTSKAADKRPEALLSIPVALRVLDFELPKPHAYFHPEQEMLISSYNYLRPNHINALNGGDDELGWRQLEAILADQVAHGQDMHFLFEMPTGSSRAERTLEVMRRVGMRTDVIMGGVTFRWGCTNRTELTALAYRIADYYDRTLGHHNAYGAYGDEESCAWMQRNRPVFDSYHAAGLKFVLAMQNGILWKGGYNWDWHDASTDAIDPTAPAKWNEMGSDTYCSWYSEMHVGPENPAYNRRQYGLGAWLAGYSAFANYAHHLGPYNDDSDTYKPMVFAYGIYDGVLDTLQWEGFREGVDDIRYGTLLKALATEANKSEDIDVRHLGRKALLYFAAFQRERADLNVARREMIGYILRLREALGAKANVKIAAKKNPVTKRHPLPACARPAPAKVAKDIKEAKGLAGQWVTRNDLESAIAVYNSLLVPTAKPQVTNDVNNAIGGLYESFFEFEKARAYYLSKGLRLKAAAVQGPTSPSRREENLRLVEAVMDDPKESAANRCEAYRRLFLADRPSADRGFDFFVKTRGAEAAANEMLSRLSGNTGIVLFGNWPKLNRMLDRVEAIDGANTNRVWRFATAQYAAEVRLAGGDAKGALLYVERGLRGAAKSKMKPEEKYQLEMMRAAYSAKDEAESVRKAVAAADGTFGKGIAPKARKKRLERVGSIAMNAGLEGTVRGLAAYVDSLVKPQPTLTYTVRYSREAIRGLGGWDRMAPRPDVAKMERPFGGSMSFVETDVSTGDRGEVVRDNTKSYARAPEWQAAFDDWGIHFRLEIFDEKAREIEVGAVGGGSIEGYLAPGENTPYVCFLHNLKPGGFEIWNSMYDQAGHRRVDPKDRATCREDMAFTDSSVVVYWAFSWNAYATRIPTDGFVWDFEPCLWGRKANATWNGLRQVHGRSSWGRLRFEMPPAARAAILRKRLIASAASFKGEYKSRGMHEGVIDHWRDPEVGDPAFYEGVLKPFADRLGAAAKTVSPKLSDAETFALEKSALGDLFEFRFRSEALRAAWLMDRYFALRPSH